MAVVIIFNISLCVKIWLNVRKDKNSVVSLKNAKIKAIKRMIFYPVVLIICYFPAAIYRFHSDFFIRSNDEYSQLIAMILICLYGFINAITYGCTSKIRNVVKIKLFGSLINTSSKLVENKDNEV